MQASEIIVQSFPPSEYSHSQTVDEWQKSERRAPSSKQYLVVHVRMRCVVGNECESMRGLEAEAAAVAVRRCVVSGCVHA